MVSNRVELIAESWCLDNILFLCPVWIIEWNSFAIVTLFFLSVSQPSNLPWPQSFSLQNRLSDRLRDLSAKGWNQLAGSGPVPWKQAPSLFNSASSTDLIPDVPSLAELSNSFDKMYCNERLPASALEKKSEDYTGLPVHWNVTICPREMKLMNGNASFDILWTFLRFCYLV